MSTETTNVPFWQPSKPLVWFFSAAAILFLLRTLLAFVTLPPTAALVASLLTTAIFIIVPFTGLFLGAAHQWKPQPAWILLLSGVILHGGALLIIRQIKPEPLIGLMLGNLMQLGMLGWTLGLGVLVSILIREKNMLLPIAIFLAGLDALLILTPFTPQARIVAENPEVVGNMGLRVPAVRSTAIDNLPIAVNDIGFVGPADLFISAMLFACLFRYRMRPRQTAIWLIPVLIAYLFLVFLLSIPLPALVPIGLTVLIVNWREFNLTKDEKAATWLVTVIALAMTGYGLYAKATYKPPAPQADSLPTTTAQEPPKPANSPTQPSPTQNR